MNPKVTRPTSAEDNYWIFIRGTAENILDLCTSTLENGSDVELNEERLAEIKLALKDFVSKGEKVVAMARLKLSPEFFPKDPPYQFNVKMY